MAGQRRLGNAASAAARRNMPRNMNGLGSLAAAEMLYYNMSMSDHAHHHVTIITTTIPARRHPPASVAPSILRLSALERLARGRGADRAALGGGVLGHAVNEPMPMTAQLHFRNLTLGYDRHPAVHHLDGAVETGALIAVVGPNGAGKSTLFKGVVGVIKPLAGRIERNGVRPQDIAYLPQVAEIDRTLPDQRLRHGGDGAVAQHRPVRRHRPQGPRHASRSAIAAVGLTGFEDRADRHAVRRPDAAHAVRAAAAAGRARDRARRAVQRRSTPRPPPICSSWCGAGTASSAPCSPRCTTSISCKANFPETLLLAREPVAWGSDRRRC